MGMGCAPTWLRQVNPPASQNHFNHGEKTSEAMQTLRAGGAKKFRPDAEPRPGTEGQYLISWRWSLPSPTDWVWWRSMHTILSYRGNRPTNKQTNPQTGPITIHCAAASAQSNYCDSRTADEWLLSLIHDSISSRPRPTPITKPNST